MESDAGPAGASPERAAGRGPAGDPERKRPAEGDSPLGEEKNGHGANALKSRRRARWIIAAGILTAAVVGSSASGNFEPTPYAGPLWLILAFTLRVRWQHGKRRRTALTDAMLGIGLGAIAGESIRYWI